MEYFIKIVFIFSLLSFFSVFTFKFLLSKDYNRIDVVESKMESIGTFLSKENLPEMHEENTDPAEDTITDNVKAELNLYETVPGEMVILKIKGCDEAEASSDLCKGIDLYTIDSGSLAALIPVKYDKEPGDYEISIKAENFTDTLKLKVLPKEFLQANIEIDEKTAKETVESKKANDEYMEKVQSLKWQNESFPMWKGKFSKPLENYRITSQFGEIRKVNGKETGRHGGIDFAAPLDTPVFSPADGKVLFADFVTLTGNTVMIEHGMGLKTLYYHLDSVNVKKGQQVKEKEVIGKVGKTGFATGPHLHFAVAVENVYVNPESFFENDYLEFIAK